MIALESKNTKVWYGLSSDEKPTTALVGSKFHETNTGLVWLWNAVKKGRVFVTANQAAVACTAAFTAAGIFSFMWEELPV
jgi:hypothetical protein